MVKVICRDRGDLERHNLRSVRRRIIADGGE